MRQGRFTDIADTPGSGLDLEIPQLECRSAPTAYRDVAKWAHRDWCRSRNSRNRCIAGKLHGRNVKWVATCLSHRLLRPPPVAVVLHPVSSLQGLMTFRAQTPV